MRHLTKLALAVGVALGAYAHPVAAQSARVQARVGTPDGSLMIIFDTGYPRLRHPRVVYCAYCGPRYRRPRPLPRRGPRFDRRRYERERLRILRRREHERREHLREHRREERRELRRSRPGRGHGHGRGNRGRGRGPRFP